MRLILSHFGQHASLRIEAATPVVMAVGRNRVGKTTLRDAVEFALLGTCALRGFSLKKDVARYMIHGSANRASVELSLGGWAVRRWVASSGAQKIWLDRHGNGGWVEVSSAEWAAFFPADPLAVRVALESDALWRASSIERTAMLSALAGGAGTVTAEAIMAELPAELRRAANEQGGLTLLRLVDLAAGSGFAAADALAVEMRREAKRERDALAALPDPMAGDWDDVRDGALAELEAGLADARAELAAAKAAQAHDAGRLRGLHEAALARHAEADARWREVSYRIWSEFPADPWPEGAEVGPCTTVPAGDLVDEARLCGSLVQSFEKAIVEANQRQAELRRLLVDPADAPEAIVPPAQCPAAPYPMDCPAKVTEFGKAAIAHRERLRADWEAGAAARSEAVAEIDALDAKLADLVERRALAASNGEALLARARLREELDQQTLRCKQAADLTQSEVERADAALADAVEAPAPEVIETFERLVEQRAERVRRRGAFERACLESSERQEKLHALGERIAFLDAVEHELRPDGIERRLSAGAAATIRSEIEEGAEVFGPIEITPQFEVLVGGRHLAAASKSEQRCAGFVLQAAVARAIGLPLVVVDEVDALDAGWRARFARYVEAVVQGGAEVLALATTDADPPARPPQGYTTAWLRPGRVEMIASHD